MQSYCVHRKGIIAEMEPSLPFNGGGRRSIRRSMETEISIGSTTLTLSAILGIAFGAAVVLFAILASIAVTCVRRKHRLEKKRMSEVKESGMDYMDLRTAIRSTRPPEICLSRRLSFNPFLPLGDGVSGYDWASQDLSRNPPMAKAKRPSAHKTFFRMTGARESWPLLSGIPLALLPGHSTMTPSPVAPPGYVVEELKWPKRSSSKLLRRKRSISQEEERSQSPSEDLCVPAKTPQRLLHRRSTSENQLSTILRSTSQRLKAAHRRSLTRTMSALGRYPGSPPMERPPTPLGKHATESREALISKRFAESVAGSLHDSYRTRSLSPRKEVLGKGFQPAPPRANSPTPSGESRDSLCGTKTPDLVIPASLTSPSKHGLRGERRHKMQISTGSAKDISMMIHNDSRPSLEAIGGQDAPEHKNILAMPHRISLASDPFYSAVKCSKPILPNTQIQGPRPQPPLYIRKATFGQEATAQRPANFCSPLQDVSGNAQPTRNSQTESSMLSPAPNPFQWSPQEAMQTRATQTSPIAKRSGSRRKGHKRSNVVRMSNLPRPPSTVDIVHEERDEDSPLRFESPSQPAIRRLEPMKSSSRPTSSASSRALSTRPPSSAVFNPSLRIPGLVARSEDNSPTLGLEDIRNDGVYSPTLSVCNYYVESGGGSEDEFFSCTNPIVQAGKSTIKARRNYSTELSLFPTHQSQQEQQDKLISFPLPSLTRSPPPLLTPSSRPLPSIDFSMLGVQLQSSSAAAAPPLLTISTPTHLTGPRSEPSKINRSDQSPLRNSVKTSIGMLRRMNSEVSHCSSPADSNNSPVLPDHHSSLSCDDEFEERGRTRGSRHYLSLGSLAPKQDKARQRFVGKRDSHRVYKERRERRNEEMERDEDGEKELTPVKEVSSPATGANALGITNLRFPTLSREGTNGLTPPRDSIFTKNAERADGTPSKNSNLTPSKDETPRWSDAMTKPAHSVIRRESKMEHPSPQTPPKWGFGLGAMGLAGQRSRGEVEGDKENAKEGGGKGRPDSLGLYDSEGFLRSSPDREAARLEREREMRDVKRLSGFVM